MRTRKPSRRVRSQKRSLFGSPQSRSLFQRRALFETLEDRRVLATLYVDDTFIITTDNGDPGLDAGDIVTFSPGAGSQHADAPNLVFGTDAFTSIQAAVNAAAPNDTIRIGSGTFSELVNINKPLTLLGNQTGVDAQDGRPFAPETIVNGALSGGLRTTALWVTASNVAIDGFTVTGQTHVNQFGAGIFLNPGTAGSQIRNNIISFNVVGLFLSNNNGANPTVIEGNVFVSNNNPGAASGNGIYTDEFVAGGTVDGVVIQNNTFLNNSTSGINFASSNPAQPVTNATISENTFTGNANGVVLTNTTNSTITQNTFSGSTNSQIQIRGGVDGLQITENFIHDGANRGIWIRNLSGTNQNISINNNSIQGNAGAGLELVAGGYTGTLNAAFNWWGAASGPTSPLNPPGTGEEIVDPNTQVNFSPFLASGVDTEPGVPGFQGNQLGPVGIAAFGTSGDDVFIVTASSVDDGTFQMITNGVPGPVVPFADIVSLSFAGLGGNDTLRIINPAGGLFMPAAGIFYDGGGQAGDTLENLGGAATSGSYVPGPTNDAGVVTHVGAVTQVIQFWGLAPVIDTVAEATFTIDANNNPNAITIDNGVANGDGRLRVSIDAFEPVEFANKTSVVVNAFDGDDTIIVDFTEVATGLATITVNAGVGADVVNVRATAAGVATTINGGDGNDTFNVGSTTNSLDAVLGVVNLNGDGGTNVLNLNDQGDASANTYEITSTQVQRTAAGPAVTVNYGTIQSVNLNAGNQADVINVRSTASGVTYLLNAGGGNDTINFGSAGNSLDGILGAVTVNGGAGTDTINVNDQGDADNNTYAINGSSVNRNGGLVEITYSNVENLFVNAGSGNDTFNVTAAPAGGATIHVDGGPPTTPPGDVLNYSGTGTVTPTGVRAGTISRAGSQDVLFSDIEELTGGPFNVVAPGDINVSQDKAFPSIITVATATGQVAFDATSLLTLSPGSGVVNLIGDNNNTTPQTDNFVVRGTGVGAFSLVLNGSPPVQFGGVSFLNVHGGEEIDTLDISAYADNTAQGWGIQVFFDEGPPAGIDGDQADLLIYNTVAANPVSETIVIQPSGPEDGELRVTNAADGSLIVVISYVNNLDIIVNDNDGFASDTDTLTLRGTNPDNPGTSGDELFIVNLEAAGTVADPMVTVDDAGAAVTLYRVRSISGFDTLNIEALGGSDAVQIDAGASDGSVTLNVDLGLPAGSDVLRVVGTADASDQFAVFPGSSSDAGRIDVQRSTASAATVINFSGAGSLEIDGGGGTGADSLVLHGTGASDVFTLTGTATSAGTAQAGAGPVVSFSALGSAGTSISLLGQGGDDAFHVSHTSDWQIATVNLSGGTGNNSVQIAGTGGDDAFVYTPASASSGQIALTSGGSTTNYAISGTSSLAIDGLGQAVADSLTTATDNATVVPGGTPGSGTVQPVDSLGAALLSLSYSNIEDVSVSGTTVVVQGTAADDTIEVLASGVVRVTNALGFFNETDLSGFANLVISALGGDDTITIAGDHPFASITLSGGEQGASDTLNFVGSGGDVTVNLGTETVQEAGFGPVSFSGIEVLNVSAAGGEIVVLGSSGGDAISVTPTGSDTATIVRAGQNLTVHTDSTGALTINALDGADSVTVHGTAGADTIHVDRGPTTQIEVVGLKLVSVVAASAESLVIAAGLGGDTINVFGSGGPANLLVDAGGAASDTLNVFNTSPGTTTVTPGNTPDSGVIATPDGNVAFAGVGFVSASGAGAGDTIVLLGTHDDDTIALQFLNAANRVWINDRAVVLFDSFEIVTLNGRFGSDTFSVHPVGLVGVTTINVIGGDPTASDSVVITGTAGNDSVNFAPTAADAMTVSGLGPVVNVSSTEHVVYNGLGGADSLTLTTPVGTHIVTLTPGGGPESGTLEVLGTAGANVLLGLSFVQAGANGLLTLADASGARADVFVLRGTDVDDRFNVEASGEVQIRESTNVVWKTKRIQTPGVAFLSLEGLDGDDAFFIAGNHPFLLVQANGGNPGASDVVNFVGSGGDVTIDLAAQTVGEAGFAPVSLSGIETLNVDAGAGSVVILGTADADDLAVTPTGADTATVVAAGFGATINTTSGSLTIDLGGGSDQLTVHGTSSGETIDVSGSAVAVGALQVVAYVGVENLRVLGHAGDDTFNVTPSTTTTYFLDGGDPIGATPGDRIVLDAGGAVVTFEPGPQNDEGGFVVAGHQRISFDHIEGVTVDGGGGGGGAIVNGTNGADSITVIARDGSTHAGADGVQDFTVTVNDGLEILFLDTPSLTINALGGSDEIAVQAPAPNGAVWNVALTIDGGLPTASDTVILGTPGTDTIIYTPSGSDSGTLEIVNLASVINLIQIEHLVYDGEAGDDSLTVVGTPADNTIVHTAGAANDEGALRVDSLLAIAYVNLGAGGVLVVDGNGGIDTLIIDGTAANDAFAVNAAGDVNLNSRLTIETTSVENLVLRGLAGSDTFAVAGDHPFASVAIQGGNGAASDSLTFVGSGGTVVVDLAAQTVLETGFGIVSLSGIETLHVQAGAGDLFVLGTGGADALSITPTGADTATVARAGQSLVLHTTNTGLLSIDPLGGNDSVTVHGTAGSDSLLVTQDGADTVVAVGGSKSVNLVSANVQLLVLATGGGDDLVTINVDAAAGSDVIPIPLVYQGGSGSDALVVVGSPATTVDEVIYQAGPTADRGRLTYEDAANVRLMSIEFSGLEPVYDYVPANLTVLGNHANNVITYSEGPNSNVVSPVNPDGALTGLISIDAFETIEFGNKLDLTIDGRAGQDTVAVVDGGNPGASGELTIVGNDPLLSNEVILSGTTGADVVNIEITGPHSAIVTINGTVTNVNTSAKLVYNGLGGNDEVTIQGIVAGDNRFVFVPGGVPDAGSLTGIDTASNVPLLPVEFVQLGVEGTLIIDGNSGMENNTLVVLGTSGHDAVSVAAISGDIALTTPAGGTHVLIVTTQINHLVLEMLEGNDLISVASPLPYDSLTVHGGDPGTGADVLNFTSSGGAVTVNLGAQTVVEAGFGPLSYSGIERINLDAGGVSPTVVATDDDDDVTVTVFSASSGTVQIGSTAQQGGQAQQPPAAPLVHYTNTGGNPIHLDLGGGEDTLIVVGNALPQTFVVDGPNSRVEIDDNGDGVNNGIVTYANAESLAVYGLEGSDTFIVTGGPIPIFIDGGDPIGAVGDTLIVTNAVAFFAGPEVDEGGFITSGEIVSFDHIELIIIQPPEDDDCPFVIFGTNADDDITVIARDASYNPLADGVQDFTVSINNGPAILFIDVPVLVIDALAGDDDIVIRGPAPNGAAWDMNITVIGGPASSVTGDQGDVLAVETPGAVDVVYTPTGSDTGLLVITNANGLVANITIQSDAFVMPPDCPELPLVGGNGGIETLIYDGEGLTGSFTIVGTDGDDTIVHTPGAGIDEGTLRVNTLLAISYQNLGSAASLTVDGGDGADTLVVLGTDLGDTFNVAATTGNVVLSNSLGTRLAIATLGVESLTLDGLEGDDTFIINAPQPYSTISALGGGPGASDVLIVNGAAGIDEAFVVTPAFANGNGSVAVNALLIPYVGIEHVLLDANEGDADTLVVNDDLADNLWTVKAGPIFGDRIQIDSRESIDYTGFTDVTLNNIFGTDRFVIHPTSLVGYSGAFTVNANLVGLADDVLELIGTEAADTVTSTATAITVNGRTITVGNVGAGFAQVKVSTLGGNDLVTLGLALPTVNLVVDGGAGDDTINLSGTTAAASVTIYGGDGDDHITGSPLDDLIYGGAGNDIIIGGPGADRMFGETGSDTFIWNPGDGSDIIEGGSDESDVLVFNGSAGDEIFTLNAVGTRLQLLRNIGNITMDVAGVEEVRLNMLGGNDSVTVNDLFQTDVRFVAIDVGTGSDAVTVNGREVSDQVNISNVDGVAVITGLRYDVHVAGVVLANNDSLTFNGLGGNDTIVANDNLSALYAVNNVLITGGDGDDFISGYGELRGDAGNDTLVGGAFGQIIRGGAGDDLIFGGGGSDQLFGDDGDDTFVLGFHGAPDIVDGGAGFNTILIQATGANERIDVQQDSPTQLRYEVSGINGGDGILGGAGTETHTLVQATIQNVLIRAGSGDDIIRVAHADGLIAAGNPANAVRFTVEGGLGNDRLTVSDLGPGDTTIHRIGSEPGSGSFQMYAFQGGVLGNPVIGMSPTVYTGIEFASLNPLDPITGGTGADGNGRLFVFKPDPYESNDSLPNATFLGSGTSINVDPTIDPGADLGFNLPGDEDWYRIVAQFTGDIDIRVFFRQQGTLLNGRAGLPGDGNLDIALYDANGDLIAGTGVFGNNDANDDERIRIPAVEGQTYYLRVRGAPQLVPDSDATVPLTNANHALPNNSRAINVYNVQVLNTPAPVPFDLELDDRIFTSTVQAGSTATSVIGSAALPPIDFTGKDLYFTSGPLNGQRGRVVSYVIATRTFNFAPNTFTGAPLAGNTFQVESVDTGRSQFDNITRDNTPTIFLRVADAALLNDIPDNGAAPGGPPDEIIVIPFVSSTLINAPAPGFRVAVFVTENNTHVPVGFAQPVPGSPGLYEFTFTTPLPDGSHFISARVEMIDPALPEQAQGFGAFAQSLEIIVDTQPPPVFFGLPNVPGDGLLPDSDTGVNPNQSTLSDRVTSNTTPGFFGQAEANAVIRLFADVNGNGIFEPSIDRQIGMTVALPFDGTNQYPTGYWQIDAINLNLNDPIFGPIDGLRRIFVTAEDVAGNINAAPFAAGVNVIEIFIDTQGPQITDVEINNVGNPYQLFDPKPSTDGPTPLVNSIWISIQDLPARTAGFLIDAFKADIASNPGHYRLVGDHNGIIPILDVNVVLNPPVAGQPATGHVQLVFRDPGPDGVFNTADDIGAALPDDRFTLFVSEDGIIDYAGNRLDGESNAAEPHQQGGPTPILGVDGVPTGDGLPGGDFVARFTVDSRPEVGVWGAGSVWIDTNGNGRWDPDNPDFTNRDITYMLGLASDHIFAGKFVATGAPNDGNARFDKLGAYGRYNGQFRWLIDTDNDGVPDVEVVDPRQINGIPVAGNFALGHPGEEVGLFTGTTWWFDTNHDWMVDTSLAFAQPGHPIVGDFDGDGLPDLAVFRDDTFFFDLSSVGSPTGPLPGNPRINGTIDRTFKFGFIGPGEIPVAADMNMDGIDDIGLWVPNRDGVAPSEGAEWYFLISGVVGNDTPPGTPPLHGPSITGGNYPIAADGPGEYLQPGLYGLTTYANGRIVADPLAPGQQIVRFNPTPFGHDEYVQFGNKFALPIVGNFDPPVSQGTTTPASNTNPNNPLDVNNDGLVSPLDALLVINHLNREGTGPAPTPSPFTAGPYLDVNSDGLITPLDALLIINYLNNPASGGQGEGEASDDFFSDLGSQQEDDDDLLAVLAADAAEQKKK